MQTEKQITVTIRVLYLPLFAGGVCVIVAGIMSIVGGPWHGWLSWAITLITVAAFAYCADKAFYTYYGRERVKRNISKRRARNLLYLIILWSAAALAALAGGGVLSHLVE